MDEEQLRDLRVKFDGCKFSVNEDPDYPGFFSVWADRGGTGVEAAGKIGEKCVALAIAVSLNQLCQ